MDRMKLERKNKNLKENLDIERRGHLQSARRVKQLEEENKELKEELEEVKKDLEHRDSFFSIMRDVLANETITNDEIAMIVYCVIHFECGDTDMSKKEVEIAEKFWNRDYV